MIYEVKIELGHRAHMKTTPAPNGFTHDWTVFVRGVDGNEIEHFVEKVVFHLHDSFPKPKRAVKEPPYTVSESGYAGFIMPIEVYFRSKEEPKRVKFVYDLYLSLGGDVNNIRLEKMTFSNPVDEFREKLLRGGGQQAPLAISGSAPPPSQANATAQNVDEQHSKQSIAAKKPKSLLPGKDPQTKPSTSKPPSPPSLSLPAPPAPKPPSQPFTEIFGAPIRTKSSSDLPSTTVKAKVPSHSKGKIAPGSTSTSSVSKEPKPSSKDLDRPSKDHPSSKESRHSSKDTHPKNSPKETSHHSHKETPRIKDPNKDTHHSAKDPHRTTKESQKSPKDSSSKETRPQSKSSHSKEVRHHPPKESHHASKEPKPAPKEPRPASKDSHSVSSKDSKHSSKEQQKETKHPKEVRHTPKEAPRLSKEPHQSPKEHHSTKEPPQKVFKKPFPAKESLSKEAHRSKNSHSSSSSKEVVQKPPREPSGSDETKPPKLVKSSSEKAPKPVKRIAPDSHNTHGQSEKKKKKLLSPPAEVVKPPPVVAKPKTKDPSKKSDERRIETSHVSVKKEKEKQKHVPPPPELPKPKPPSPVQKYPSSLSSEVDSDSDSDESKKSNSVRGPYSSSASSISETSLDGSHPYTMNSIKESTILSPLTSDSDMSLSPVHSPKPKSSSGTPQSRAPSRMSSGGSPSNSPKRKRSSSDSPSPPPQKRSPQCSDSSRSSGSRDSDSSDSDVDVESPPNPEPELKPVVNKRYHDPSKHSNHKSSSKHPHHPPSSHHHHVNNNVQQGHYTAPELSYDSNSLREELLQIQRKIMASEDRRLLQKVVDVIEKTGMFELSTNSFDFDLCELDPITLKKLKYIVYTHL